MQEIPTLSIHLAKNVMDAVGAAGAQCTMPRWRAINACLRFSRSWELPHDALPRR